ncbi:unnamed protein product [Prorocentrum cordatum]|uniref:Cellulase n=1 Tax=Prorocentrum cordatum TaxID=2364126 RepID=A0ABN9QSX0_9DINO|nr:unnamed protein product [Polarella glacialis]
MKQPRLAALAAALAAVDGGRVHSRVVTAGGLRNASRSQARGASGALGNRSRAPRYGSPGCPCIGVDYIKGEKEVRHHHVDGKSNYAAESGSSCSTWDHAEHPMCKGDNQPDFCGQQWCYVDPCDCDIEVPPKPSIYMDKATYQGHRVHYSYHTCGGVDTWTPDEKKAQARENVEICDEPVDTRKYGKDGCHCVGIDGLEGETMVSVEGRARPYPADVGSSCSAWDDGRHPNCTAHDAPAWCKERWCYVDPCLCDLKTPPQESVYIENAVWQGRPMYYSYTTCGSTDHFTNSQGSTACTQYADKPSCENDDNERWCQWEPVRGVCLGKELIVVCSGDAHAGDRHRGHEGASHGAGEAHEGHAGAPCKRGL